MRPGVCEAAADFGQALNDLVWDRTVGIKAKARRDLDSNPASAVSGDLTAV